MARLQEAPVVFLKLGGSMLGDKARPRSFRRAAVARVAEEIRRSMDRCGPMRLVLGHGAGAPPHHAAHRYRTRDGLPGGGGWLGFAATRRAVIDVNRRVLDGLARGGMHPVLVSPCAGVVAGRGEVRKWDVTVIREILARGQVPLIHGDAVVDAEKGFTILSTEELFAHLAQRLRPQRIVLACDVEGVYRKPPRRSKSRHRSAAKADVVPVVNRANVAEVLERLRLSGRRSAPRTCDVTGGMAAKVQRLYELASRFRRLELRIVSGLKRGAIERALAGEDVGTRICYR